MKDGKLGNILHNVVSGAGGLVHAGWHGVQHAISSAGRDLDDEGGGGLLSFKGSQSRTILAPERPPPIEEALETLANHGDAVSQDWRWLALRCEQRLNAVLQQRTGNKGKLSDTLGTSFDIRQFACFMPRTVLEAIADRRIRYSDDFDIQIEQFTAAVVFCDASGFTALTEALDTKPNGAERLGNIINQFFDKIIKIVHYWGGDIIKFSGDAMTIVWPVDDEEKDEEEKPSSSRSATPTEKKSNRDDEGLEDFYKIDSQVACQLAVQCCLTLHQTLHGYATGCDDKVLTLHIGVGFGQVHILQVGGIMDRWEYVVAGSPLEEISIAEPLAGSGETVVSPSVAHALAGTAILEEAPNSPEGRMFYKVTGLLPPEGNSVKRGDSLTTLPPRPSSTRATGLALTEGEDSANQKKDDSIAELPVQPPPPLAPIDVEPDDIDLLRRYIPPAVFRRLTSGCNVFLNELRVVSVMFICVRGLDVSTRTGSLIAHKLMKMTQKAAYTMEGSVNKFLVDDKGVLLLVMFGLPPVYHLDDPIRAIMAALRVIDGMKVLGLDAGIGITSGRVWCGTVGNEIRKEYTALGDYVNLSARLMGKAGPREIFVDVNTFKAARHALEFKQLPSMHVKGKEHPVQVFMPTGVMINPRKDQLEDHPLLSWPHWSGKKQLREIMMPSSPYLDQSSLFGRGTKYNTFRPPLDYPVAAGPLFAHEWYEPFLPQLQPLATIGGVMVIKGKEGLGTHELAKLLGQIGRKDLNRQMFFISNMPDSVQMNIGNVPLLAWRKLCTEMVERWRVSDNREKKGYSKIDRDNSVYGLTKELIHPSFHWRLEDMKSVIHGLVLPYELPENQRMLKQRLKNFKYYQKRHAHQGGMRQFPMMMSPAFNLFLKPAEWVGDAAAAAAAAARTITPVNALMTKINHSPFFDQDDGGQDSDDSDDSDSGLPCLGLGNPGGTRGSGESIAPIIASLVNGFTLYESSIIVLHVRTGTSVFAEMDRDSWKVARMVARVSLVRRTHRLENDMKDLKEWRRAHSRKCWWCKGYRTRTVTDSSGREHLVQPTSLCRPLPSQFYQPLLFVLICSETTDNVPEQQQLVQMARDNNALIELKKLGLEETADYLGHCLGIRKKGLDPSFVQYVQRASAGIPKYAYLTARKLVADGAVVLTPEGGLSKTRKNPKDTSASTSGRSGGGGPYSSSESMQRGYLGKQRGEAVGPRDTSGESKKGRGSTGDDSDEVEDDGDSEDDEEDEEEEEERKEEDEVARHVCDLIEKVRLHREQINHLQNGMGGPVSGPAGLVSTPNDSWTHSAVYDTLPPDVRAPDASSLVLNPPPLSAFDLGMMDEHSMLYGDLTSLSQPGLSGLGGGTGGGPDMPSQMYLAAKYRDRLHGRSSEEDQGGMGADFSDKMHGLADGSGRRVSLPANYTGGTGAGGGIASHRNQQGGLAYGPGGGGGGGAGGRSNLGGTAAHGGAITGHSTPCNRGGGRLMLGRAADRQRVEDDARISRGKLTRAEFAFLQNAPPWVHLDDIDIRGLALYKKRRWAAARNLDWDSDAECAVEPAEESSESGNLVLGGGGERGFHPHRRRPRCTRYTGMIVKADLQSLPFIPELIANCMFTVERLQPEEQMVAKVASVFPCSFNPIELCRAYPRRKPLEEFCGIIYQLVVKDVLEVCDPPSADDLASLAVSVGFEKPKTGSSSGGTAGETTGGHGGGKTGGGRRTIEAIVPRTKRLSNLLNAQDHIHNNSSSRLSHSSVNGNLRESIGNLSTSSSLQPPPILGGGWPSGPRGSDASISGDGSPVGAGAVGRTSTSSRRESKLGGSQDASLEDAPFPGLAPGHERRPSVMKAGGVVTPQRLFEGSLGAAAAREAALPAGAAGSSNIAKAGAVVSRALWETVLMTDDGSDVFLRFNSIALQRVVSDLLLADERKWLTLVCRRIIALRFTEDCSAPAVKTTRSKAGSAAAASAGASKKKKTPPGEGVVKPSEKQGGDTPVLTEDVSSSNASVAEDKDEEEEDEEEILSGDQPPIPQSLVETALAAERETHEQLARNEEAEAVKEHKEEIERLVSKAVLSRCSSSHTIVGRSLSRKGTSSVLGSSRSNTMNGCNNSNSHMSRVSSWRVGEEEEEHQEDHDDHRVAGGDRDKKSVDGAEQGIRLEGE